MRYKIVLVTEEILRKLNPGGYLRDVKTLMVIPQRLRFDFSKIDISCTYIQNHEAAIRACLINDSGDVIALFTLSDIDFEAGLCKFNQLILTRNHEAVIKEAGQKFVSWTQSSLGLQTLQDVYFKDRLITGHENVFLSNLPTFCIDRISDEVEKSKILNYFDAYMFTPLSVTPDGSLSAEKMIAASEMLLAYDKRPAGFIAFYGNNLENRTAYVSSIVVSDNYRKRGIGKSLLDYCCRIAVSRGMRYIVLKVKRKNLQAIRFYEKQHFIQMSDDTSEDEVALYKQVG